MTGDSADEDTSIDEGEAAEELTGSLASNPDEERLMRSVLENDEDAVQDGKIVMEAINRSVGAFTPDIIFKNLVKNYQNARRLYGETLLRALTGYGPDFIRKNLRIPEFQEELRQRIHAAIDGLRDRGTLDAEDTVTDRAVELAALVLYAEELDALATKGLGTKSHRERDVYGEKDEVHPFSKRFRFRDISLRKSVRVAARRGHEQVRIDDLRAHERLNHGRIQIIYGLDSSGSMRGDKIRMGKRAGVALAYRAIEQQDEVGLLTFTGRIEAEVAPTRDFPALLHELTRARAGMETDLARLIERAVEVFAGAESTKHLVIITDAVPTKGEDPQRATLDAAAIAANHEITISIVGISLDNDGRRLAERIVEIANGRLYRCTNLDELDAIILEDYAAL